MRTHLLCVIPEVELDPEVESEAPVAADGTYQVVLAATLLMLTLARANHLSPPSKENAVICEANDDYWLDGYAGI